VDVTGYGIDYSVAVTILMRGIGKVTVILAKTSEIVGAYFTRNYPEIVPCHWRPVLFRASQSSLFRLPLYSMEISMARRSDTNQDCISMCIK
jgi:hypothetical protein